ncbi:unnamed protein product [Ilex paraguariensis]|uniref:Uncharacterized protein n=1 Tax=Ilex paraguariensis TaxID=185542 RepID=A0ABC8S709_9AQUA
MGCFVLHLICFDALQTLNMNQLIHLKLGGFESLLIIYSWASSALSHVRQQFHQQSSSVVEEQLDPFSLVADELSIVANGLRSMVVAEVPKLAVAAEYFFKIGVEGKRFRPTYHALPVLVVTDISLQILLLMATALKVHISGPAPNSAVDTLSTNLRTRQQCVAEITEMIHVTPDSAVDTLSTNLRTRQQCVAEITEMIHVASLLHDDVLDDADKRRGIGSLNCVMGNKISVLAGNFLLSRACVALASLKNTEVLSLIATVVQHLVTGETMQLTTTSEKRCSMEYYMQKTYYKTASLISNSCKSIALLAGQTAEVSILAYEYGKNLDKQQRFQYWLMSMARICMEYYMQKTYYKTASLISNSCKSIALLAGQTAEVSILAYEYGKNLGLAYQLIDDVLDFTGTSASLGKGSLSDIRHGIVTAPILFAIEEFPELRSVVDRGFDNPANVDLDHIWICSEELNANIGFSFSVLKDHIWICSEELNANIGFSFSVLKALDYLGKSRGIQRTRELAAKHANLASASINSLPESDDEDVQKSRRALIELTQIVIKRTNVAGELVTEQALDYLGKSRGIQRTRELAAKHANLASASINSLPESDDEDVQKSRRALIELTQIVIKRTK